MNPPRRRQSLRAFFGRLNIRRVSGKFQGEPVHIALAHVPTGFVVISGTGDSPKEAAIQLAEKVRAHVESITAKQAR